MLVIAMVGFLAASAEIPYFQRCNPSVDGYTAAPQENQT